MTNGQSMYTKVKFNFNMGLPSEHFMFMKGTEGLTNKLIRGKRLIA